ncbi:MAG: S8 family serine peptidase [Bacteriovoracaceae bacterium]|jgi:subtilisin family serine protease|nr:S8 family serine peptidase [Bacteriovoracaceae bacterium]
MNLKKLSNFFIFLSICFFQIYAEAETVIGIYDSGVDPIHLDLEHKLKRNSLEKANNRDDDHNNAIDDIFGWNLIDENDKVFKDELRETFPPKIYKYYQVKTKKALGTISISERRWYEEIRKDELFLKTLKIFKSFIHGTHITGIAVKTEGHLSHLDLKYYPIRYLGSTETGRWIEPEFTALKKGTHKTRLNHIKKYFTRYSSWQKKKWLRAIELTHKDVEIINGSFGKSFKSVLKVSENKYKSEFGNIPTEEIKVELANDLLQKLVILTEQIANKYPKFLFVFSAGNSKTDNDQYLHYPSNARASNIISVGASKQHIARAYFSNFGKKTVDLFAPGLAINSTIPSNSYIRVNGTSQASPYISNVAAKALEIAKQKRINLSIKSLKTILLRTVDKKKELLEQSVSGGIVNPERVYAAIRLLKRNSVKTAVNKSMSLVGPINSFDKTCVEEFGALRSSDTLIDALPEPF